MMNEEKRDDLSVEDQAVQLMKEANELVSARDKEIAELKLKLGRSELYRKVEDDVVDDFDISEGFDTKGKSNLEIAEYVVKTHQYYVDNGTEELSPLNVDGEGSGSAVAEFLQECVNAADGNPSNFLNAYQLKLGADTAAARQAYNKYNNNKGRK